MSNSKQSTQRIARLNDTFRQTFLGGKVMITRGIAALDDDHQRDILWRVQTFSAFTPDNDPYEQHDFGAFDYQGHRIFWKIDYYDPTFTFGSKHPEDSRLTQRVLTILLAEEY